MYDDIEIQEMTLDICHNRLCPNCPIRGFCDKSMWSKDSYFKQRIIESHMLLFPDHYGKVFDVNDTEIMDLFGD